MKLKSHYVSLVLVEVSCLVGKRKMGSKFYPLTAAGCRLAGRELADDGVGSWMYMSSVDFPQYIKPRCGLDVRGLIFSAYSEREREHSLEQVEFLRLMISHCSRREFLSGLSVAQKGRFRELKLSVGRWGRQLKAGGV